MRCLLLNFFESFFDEHKVERDLTQIYMDLFFEGIAKKCLPKYIRTSSRQFPRTTRIPLTVYVRKGSPMSEWKGKMGSNGSNKKESKVWSWSTRSKTKKMRLKLRLLTIIQLLGCISTEKPTISCKLSFIHQAWLREDQILNVTCLKQIQTRSTNRGRWAHWHAD